MSLHSFLRRRLYGRTLSEQKVNAEDEAWASRRGKGASAAKGKDGIAREQFAAKRLQELGFEKIQVVETHDGGRLPFNPLGRDEQYDRIAPGWKYDSSRRDMLKRAVLLGGGAAALAVGSGMVGNLIGRARAAPGAGIAGTTLSPTDIDAKRIGGVRYATEFDTAKHAGTSADPWNSAAWQNAVTDLASIGGKVIASYGMFRCSALQYDAGIPEYYAVGIPASLATDQYGEFFIEGMGAPFFAAEWTGAPIQTKGTILSIAQSALTAIGVNPIAAGIYSLFTPIFPGNNVHIRDLGVRFPSNSRSHIHAVDMLSAADCYLENILCDFDIAYPNMPAPTSGDLYGFQTINSSRLTTELTNCIAVGFNYGFNFASEHLYSRHCWAFKCGFPFLYQPGAGQSIFHPGYLEHFSETWCGNGPQFKGSADKRWLEILSYDLEYTDTGTWTRNQGATEETIGYTRGILTYTAVKSGTGILHKEFFNAGHGVGFTVYESFNKSSGLTAPANPPISGTVYRNDNAVPMRVYVPVTFNPTGGAAATFIAATGWGSGTTVPLPTESVPIGGPTGIVRTFMLFVPAGWYYKFTVTEAVLGNMVLLGE